MKTKKTLESTIEGGHKSKGIASSWLAGKSGKELEDHVEWLQHGTLYWNELRTQLQMLYNQTKAAESDFSSPNWAVSQAARVGYEKALQDVYKILPRPKE